MSINFLSSFQIQNVMYGKRKIPTRLSVLHLNEYGVGNMQSTFSMDKAMREQFGKR